MRKRAELLAHITGVADRCPAPKVRQTVEVDLQLIDYDDELLRKLELSIVQTAQPHDSQTFSRLRSIPGVGKLRALVLLYEIHAIHRCPRVQACVSSARLVTCPKESAGKRSGTGGHKLGNVHLQRAFSAAAVRFLRKHPLGQADLTKLARTHGKAKALSLLAHQLGRAVYCMLKRHEACDMHKFLAP
jgi:transposase